MIHMLPGTRWLLLIDDFPGRIRQLLANHARLCCARISSG
jgi:hypothetical protein